MAFAMIDRDLDWVFKALALFRRRVFLLAGAGVVVVVGAGAGVVVVVGAGAGVGGAGVGAGVGAMQECVHAVQELKFDTTQ